MAEAGVGVGRLKGASAPPGQAGDRAYRPSDFSDRHPRGCPNLGPNLPLSASVHVVAPEVPCLRLRRPPDGWRSTPGPILRLGPVASLAATDWKVLSSEQDHHATHRKCHPTPELGPPH